MDEAIQAALETESVEKVESERRAERKPVKFVRAVDTCTEQRLQKLEGDTGEQIKKMDMVLELLSELSKKNPEWKGRRPYGLRCFNCGEAGHLKREYTKPRRNCHQGNANQPTGGPTGRLESPEGPNVSEIQKKTKPTRGEEQRLGNQ